MKIETVCVAGYQRFDAEVPLGDLGKKLILGGPCLARECFSRYFGDGAFKTIAPALIGGAAGEVFGDVRFVFGYAEIIRKVAAKAAV